MARRKEQAPDPLPAPESLTYEEAISELESIIDRIERGDIGLEESLRQFERGNALARRCDTVLLGAEQRIVELDRARLAQADGECAPAAPNGDGLEEGESS